MLAVAALCLGACTADLENSSIQSQYYTQQSSPEASPLWTLTFGGKDSRAFIEVFHLDLETKTLVSEHTMHFARNTATGEYSFIFDVLGYNADWIMFVPLYEDEKNKILFLPYLNREKEKFSFKLYPGVATNSDGEPLPQRSVSAPDTCTIYTLLEWGEDGHFEPIGELIPEQSVGVYGSQGQFTQISPWLHWVKTSCLFPPGR